MIIDLQTLDKHPAIKKHQLGAIVADMATFNGWIRCSTSMPLPLAKVHATDGHSIYEATYDASQQMWIVNGMLDFDNENGCSFIAWRLLPEIPKELIEKCK